MQDSVVLAAIDEQRGQFLSGRGKISVARAPARLDVIGGIADYSGSLVLEGTLAPAAYAAVQRRRDRQLRVMTVGVPGMQQVVELSLGDLHRGHRLRSYAQVSRLFPAGPARWAGYVLGTAYVLLKERVAAEFSSGLNLLLHSDIPLGAGVASSAAIEVAAMRALAAAFSLELEGLELARLCQLVENRVVGAPCGIMDQVTSALGEPDELLAILCRPYQIAGHYRTPAGYRFLGINSGVKHSVGGPTYARVRAGAFMGQAIVAAQGPEDSRRAYWCHVTPQQFVADCEPLLPEEMTGQEFLERYGATADTVTTVEPAEVYPVRQASRHPVFENARVHRFRDLLGGGGESAMREAGDLMYAAHESYGACGLGCEETDLLVSLVRELGPERGMYGAKITGGGSGGTVAVLAREGADDLVEQVAAEYRERTGVAATILTGSSPGAMAWGVREL